MIVLMDINAGSIFTAVLEKIVHEVYQLLHIRHGVSLQMKSITKRVIVCIRTIGSGHSYRPI